MAVNILIVDDEVPLRKLIGRILALEAFNILEAGTIKAALDILKLKAVDIVLCDVKLPDGNGVDFTLEIKQRFPLIEIILLTAYGNIPDGVRAIKNGAFDYITKGNDNDRIVPLLFQAADKISQAKKNAVKVNPKGNGSFNDIIGNSPAITATVALARRIAPSAAPVLLLGETGTGKEVFANAIHTASPRASMPFVALNCSAFTKELLEGELFGHKAGAFTGATKDKKGLVQIADRGTLFLDEIGELNIELQAKLLRVLENGEFIRVGDEKTSRTDIRIIAATNKDLPSAITEGRFREDLYYRLNVVSIHLPPLRDRKEDIPVLADHFMAYFSAAQKQTLKMDTRAEKLLQQYEWKGNIRELRNVVQRAVILADSGLITAADLPYEIQTKSTAAAASLTLASVEKNHIARVLVHFQQNKTKTAEALGIGLTTLYRKIEEFGLTNSDPG